MDRRRRDGVQLLTCLSDTSTASESSHATSSTAPLDVSGTTVRENVGCSAPTVPASGEGTDVAASTVGVRSRAGRQEAVALASSDRRLRPGECRQRYECGPCFRPSGRDVLFDDPVVVYWATREGWTLKLQAMEPITVREARRSDREALARIHAEVARYYLDLALDYLQVLERFAEQLDADAPPVDRAALHLVAEADGEVVGALVARLLPPEAPAQREVTPELEATRLRIEYLATAAASRRQGLGTRLVEAAEAWGRDAGATVAETTTYQGSPLSVPFWGERMGYEELSVNLRKPL